MFDRFGNMNSAMEINVLAINLRKEGDVESILILASENGIDPDIADAFIEGDLLYLCDEVTAAIGKLEIESKSFQLAGIMDDWVQYLKSCCFEDVEVAKAVRQNNKSMKGCFATFLAAASKSRELVDSEILKLAGLQGQNVTLGMPSSGTIKKMVHSYYLG